MPELKWSIGSSHTDGQGKRETVGALASEGGEKKEREG